MRVHLIRDVLDNALVDHRHDPMGKVDGLTMELREGAPPRVVAIECGFPVLARRVHPRLERWVRAIGLRWGVRRGRVLRIALKKVRKIDREIELDADADRSPASAWENWLRRHFTSHIPGSGS